MVQRLTPEEIEKIRKLHAEGLSYTEISRQTGRSETTAARICDPEFRKRHNAAGAKWRKKNRQEFLDSLKRSRQKDPERDKKRRLVDPAFHIACNLRSRLRTAIRDGAKSGSAVRDLGCTIDELKDWLELYFTEGMSWETYGDWHIDHIRPLVSFDLTDRSEFLQACHFTNLQPLWEVDNLKKGSQEST